MGVRIPPLEQILEYVSMYWQEAHWKCTGLLDPWKWVRFPPCQQISKSYGPLMDLIPLVVRLGIAGFLVYLWDLLVPMNEKFRKAFFAVVGFAAFLYILQYFHIIPKMF